MYMLYIYTHKDLYIYISILGAISKQILNKHSCDY